MRYVPLAVAACLSISCSTISAQSPSCSREQAMMAEKEASTLSSWQEVLRSFHSFSACDDGAIAEGYSEAVSRLLAEYWSDAPVLMKLAKEDPYFAEFVVRHIDETVPKARLDMIRSNVRERCPVDGQELCAKLESASN